MTNLEKVKKANDLLKQVLINEIQDENLNDSSLMKMELSVIVHIVNHWYITEEEKIFVVDDCGTEIDEYLVDYLNLINQ